MQPALRLLLAATLGLSLAACKSAPPEAPAQAEQPASPPAAPAPAAAPEQQPVPVSSALTDGRTDLLSVTFLQVSEAGYPEVELKNLSDKDIETVSGGFQARNEAGELVWSTGLTVAVPGNVFLAAGATRVATPFGLNRKEEMMEILRTNPDSLSFSFVAREVGFSGD